MKVDIKGLPDTTVHSGSQTSQMIMFEAKGIFTSPPTMRISYMAGALQALTLQLPVAPHKYMEGAVLSGEDFFKRWKQIGGAPRESQKIFQGYDVSGENTRRLLQGFKWGVLDGVDPNVRNFVGATVLHTGAGKYGYVDLDLIYYYVERDADFHLGACSVLSPTQRTGCIVLRSEPLTSLCRRY